jgi:hypothetical protein
VNAGWRAPADGRVGLGRYRDVVWSPPGPDGPTSELYRLMPPQHPSSGRPDDGDPIMVISPDLGRWRELAARARPASRRAAGWAWGLFTAAAAVVIGSLVYAWLTGH